MIRIETSADQQTFVADKESLGQIAQAFVLAMQNGSSYATIRDGNEVVFRIHVACEE